MLNKFKVGAVLALATVAALPASAWAQTAPDPEAEVTSFLTAAFGTLAPIVVAVAVGSLGILTLTIGLRMAQKAVRSRGQTAA